MTIHRRRSPRTKRTLHLQAAELAWAVPQVVAHRLARIAGAGLNPTLRDRKEFARMVSEKHDAFGESWQAMAWQALHAQQAFAAALARAALSVPSPRRKNAAHALAKELQRSALAVAGKGLAPVHRRAVANAKRLGRAKLR